MKKRFISIMMALLLVAGLPVSAFADGTYYLDYGDITVTANDDGSGNTTQTVSHYAAQGDTTPTSVTDSNPTITQTAGTTTTNTVTINVTQNAEAQVTIKDVTIENANHSTQQHDGAIDINVDKNATADVKLDNVTIKDENRNNYDFDALSVQTSSGSTANITLDDVNIDVSKADRMAAMNVDGYGKTNVELDGDNQLISGSQKAGLQKESSTGTLNITDVDNNGKLTATGGTSAAGIGGCYSTENITIEGGMITANGGSGAAGIGGGSGAYAKNIIISGGKVEANGGTNAAGIGGGSGSSTGSSVTITGGEVIARGNGGGAGIGNGYFSSNGSSSYVSASKVTISGTTAKAPIVKVQGGSYKAADDNTYTAAGIGYGVSSLKGDATSTTTYYNGKEILPITCALYGGTIQYYKQGAETMDSTSLLEDMTITGVEGTGKDGGVHHAKAVEAKEASCYIDGNTAGTVCAECGVTLTGNETIEHGHKFGEWSETTPATCGSSGTKTHICSVCKTPAYGTIPATGEHKEVIDEAVAATCTKTGLTEGGHCSECGTVIKAQEVTSATDHNWNDGNVIVAPTADTYGLKYVVCQNCGAEKFMAISSTGDTDSDDKPDSGTTGGDTTGGDTTGGDTTGGDTTGGDTTGGDTTGGDTTGGDTTSGDTTGGDKTDGGKSDGGKTDSGNTSTSGNSSRTSSTEKKTADELSKYKLATLYRVTNEGNYDVEHTAVIKNGVLTITAEKDFANLKGRLSGIIVLMSYGVEKIEFVTNGATSTFALVDLIVEGGASDGYVLTHDGANVTFTLGSSNADISSILQS